MTFSSLILAAVFSLSLCGGVCPVGILTAMRQEPAAAVHARHEAPAHNTSQDESCPLRAKRTPDTALKISAYAATQIIHAPALIQSASLKTDEAAPTSSPAMLRNRADPHVSHTRTIVLRT